FIASDVDASTRAEYLLARSYLVEGDRTSNPALIEEIIAIAPAGSAGRAGGMTDPWRIVIESGRAIEGLAAVDGAADAARAASCTHLVGSALHCRLRAEFMTLEGNPESTLTMIREEIAGDDGADVWEYWRSAESYAANRRGDRETALRMQSELI